MNYIRFSMFALCCLVFSMTAQSQDMSNVKIEATKLTDNIYMLTGQGGNIGVWAGDDGVYVIDDQYAPLRKKIQAAVAKISDKPIKMIINTHWHGDHTGGNAYFHQLGAMIIAHNNVRTRLQNGQDMPGLGRTVAPAEKAALPVLTFEDGVNLFFNGEPAQLIHYANAHTDGDTAVFWPESNVLHTGDLLFNGIYPFIDGSSGGGIEGMIAADEALLKLVDGDTKIVPGHGPLTDKAGLENFLAMLKTVHQRIKAAKDAGKSVSEFIKEKPLADLDAEWGDGFLPADRFIAIVWQGM